MGEVISSPSATGFASSVGAALAAGDDAGEPSVLETERCVFMRYAGQGWEIPVRLEGGPFDHLGGELLANRFEKAYEEFFGRAIAGLAVEAIGWSARVSTRRPEVERVARLEAAREVAIQRTRPIHDAGTDSVVEAAVVEREALSPGDRVGGPAVIVEPQTTTWVSSNRQAVVQADGCLLITRSDAEGSSR